MKLIILLTIVACLQVSAKGYAQGISLSVKNASLEKVFREINKQAGYDFLYKDDWLQNAKKVSIEAKNSTIEQILEKCFKDQPLTYTIVEKVITIKPKSRVIELLKALIDVRGKVVNENGDPVVGATISVKGTDKIAITNNKGEFTLNDIPDGATLIFTSIGYEPQQIKLSGQNEVAVKLKVKIDELSNIQVSTGYQTVPKERATGSFDHINNDLFNRSVSTDVLSRLEGIASGVLFPNKNIPVGATESPISIRGRSTIFSNTLPLIVLDNFPYDGDINNINPNDVESITILKDAAAASIWGARSANGVIVITTKKGRLNQPLKISVNSNFTIGSRPDLYYDPNYLDANTFIEVEKFLFSKGYYDGSINNTRSRPILSPVVEILTRQRNGQISDLEASNQISALKPIDNRVDFKKNLFRNSQTQQHSINVSGGSTNGSYYISSGFDNTLPSLRGNKLSRLTLNAFNSYTLIKNLELSAGISFVETNTTDNNQGLASLRLATPSLKLPYIGISNNSGNAIAVPKDYRFAFIDTVDIDHLLDWKYKPLDEIAQSDNTSKTTDFLISPSIRYSLNGLELSAKYQYQKQFSESRDLQNQSLYFTRNLINLYTQANGNSVERAIPLGAILDLNSTTLTSQNLRLQASYNRRFHKNHNLAAIIGFEQKELIVNSNGNRTYGYDDNTLTSSPVNLDSSFKLYGNLKSAARIPTGVLYQSTTDEYRSYYANAAYSYLDRYTVTASARIDQSNLFGVEANQKSVPLWSLGLGYEISNEKFYHISFLPFFKLRATYGVNGNLNKSLTAYTTAKYFTINNSLGLVQASILNPPNPYLKWETVRLLNLGTDFRIANNIIFGSIEFYFKKADDLIGETAVAPSVGVSSYTGNIAAMSGKGIDIDITTKNADRTFKWYTNWLFSYTSEKITDYNIPISTFAMVQTGAGLGSVLNPIVGKPLYAIYSYQWGGLDTLGDPQSFLNGKLSKDYSNIINNTPADELIYHGSARPTIFGSLRNTVEYKGFSLSANLIYKLNYFFRAPSINYSELFGSWVGHPDYVKRWQKPGDEAFTSVPSAVYPSNRNRDNLYTYSSLLVEKGDHIRLQDVRLSYDFAGIKLGQTKLQQFQVYVYANNIGIIWKANKVDIDPDYLVGYPIPFSIAFGLKATF